MTRTEIVVLSGLPFNSADYCDFRTHEPRLRIDGFLALSGRFVARVSASVAAIDRCPGRGRAIPAADNAFASVSAVPTEVEEGYAEPPGATTPLAQPIPLRSLTQGADQAEPTGRTAPALAPPAPLAPPTVEPCSDRISTRTRRRTATAGGTAPLAVDYGFRPAGPLDHLPGGLPPRRECNGRGRVRPRPRPLPLPPRRSRRCLYRPTATVQRLWELLSSGLRPHWATYRLDLRGWMLLATLLNRSSPIPSRVIHMPMGCGNSRRNRRAAPQYVTSTSGGRRYCRPTFCSATPRTSVPLFRTSRNWLT